MVAVQYEVEGVGHLTVKVHASLETAHLLHTAHPLVLRDDNGTGLGTKGINLHHELRMFNLWQLGAEDG